MTHFADLTLCTYFAGSVRSGRLLSIGWLEPTHDFVKGPVSDEFRVALRQAVIDLRTGWAPVACAGGQLCGFCDDDQAYSSSNLFVVGSEAVFTAPEGVLHYVEAHRYQPPADFIEAVLNGPASTTVEYFEGLARADIIGELEVQEKLAEHLRYVDRVESDWI